MSVKAQKESEQALADAKYSEQRAKQALQQAREEEQLRYKAQSKARDMENKTEHSKMTYKKLFIGNAIFTLALAFFIAYIRRSVLVDMVHWFSLRWHNITSISKWLYNTYTSSVNVVKGWWQLSSVLNYLIVTVATLIILALIYFALKFIINYIRDFILSVKEKIEDNIFKQIISIDITLISLYITLFFSDSIKVLVELNSFSIWLILSLVGICLWHTPEIYKAISNEH